MANDDVLTEAIQLIKAGKKDAARAILEPFLQQNPKNVQAWMWEAEIFPNDRDKITVLEACLKQNPNHPQATQAVTFLRNRAERSSESVPQSSSFSSSFSSSSALSNSVAPVVAPQQKTPITDSAPRSAENPNRSQPSIPKSAKPQKKSKQMTAQTTNIIIAVMACATLFIAIGSYLGGGFYLNGQINNFFIAQNCAGVTQSAVFVSAYPKGIFASMFASYDQYAECQSKLGVEQAVEAKNWGEAFARAQTYLAIYPNGSFAAAMNEQSLNSLSVWAEELIARKDYGGGIEKLQQLIKTYPKSSQAQLAPSVIFQTYILWSNNLTEKKNYAEAEQRLNAASAYFQTDAPRAEPIKQELVNLYLVWGAAQIQIGNIDGGIKYYEKADALDPEKTDVALLSARAYLQKALDVADKNDFDRALLKVKEIADAAQTENVKSEAATAREKILAAYSASTSQQAITQTLSAIASTCKEQRPELPIFGLDAEKNRFGMTSFNVQLPVSWTATTPSELRYVICISETEDQVQSCPYQSAHTMFRLRYVWKVALYDILSGEKFDEKTLKGSDPAACKSSELFTNGVSKKKTFGKRPTVDEILAWLEELKIAK